ncbi:MAG: heavy-metal-associated domain-containing protein [Thermomonas sp.]|uniref:heavy-metal-associated domain-containing protein n=1 Tax=Thermomonas sp. TaxID=1971895 RepID=UPI002630A34B|nr:heavy-metal-associated domain-containing protein [Thermomonas sp.]MCC7095883.1 heavy-metal-associated domain-containing protein [Thermomonas sp.]
MLLNVENMSCQHCVNAVTRALQALDATARVEVDLASKQVRAHGQFSADAVIAALADADYTATLISNDG